MTEVLKFLHSLKSKGFSYSNINSVRSPLSAFITLEGLEAGKIKFPSYHDKTICPMEVLKCYLDLKKDIRGDFTGLFITTTKPYRKASKDKGKRNAKRGRH